MIDIRQMALGAYYYSTLPGRKRAADERARRGRSPIMIVFYHRVADTFPNDWTISNQQFERQIDWLKENFDLISLAQAQDRIRSGRNSRPAVCITFDDGYSENCHHALPLLVRERIPVTYFVTSQNIATGDAFAHDLDAGQALRPNTPEQLRAMVKAGIEIGGHTRTHPDLGKLENEDQLRDEVIGCRLDLQRMLDTDIDYFSFPFGLPANLNREAFKLALQAGYEGVCTAYGGYNLPTGESFHLRRIHADPEMIRFKNWLTIDPRKVALSNRQDRIASDSISDLESASFA